MCLFFVNDTATTEIYTDGHTLSLHDALPILGAFSLELVGLDAEALDRAGIEATHHDREDEPGAGRSEEHTSELQSLMRISYAVFCLKNKTHLHTASTATLQHNGKLRLDKHHSAIQSLIPIYNPIIYSP